MTPMKLQMVRDEEYPDPYPFVVISQRRNDRGWPQFDAQTLGERWQTEEDAIFCAEQRLQEGYWVTVYTEVAHGISTE